MTAPLHQNELLRLMILVLAHKNRVLKNEFSARQGGPRVRTTRDTAELFVQSLIEEHQDR